MTEYELDIVRETVKRVLKSGTPGLAEVMRDGIVNTIMLRLRHEFNVPAPRERNP